MGEVAEHICSENGRENTGQKGLSREGGKEGDGREDERRVSPN